ncbi:MAG: ATP-grasp domain-containing protein [Singulisphaera sp.]
MPPDPWSLLIVGASARSAAYSTRRAGGRPSCVDLFADRDLAAICPAARLSPREYPDGLARLAAEASASPWMYTGALENHPELVDRIAGSRPLWGNDGSILRAVRDPIAVAASLRRAGLPCPRVRLSPAGLPRDESWLVKPLASAGGRGVQPLGPSSRPVRVPSYYQERIAGPSLSALFVGARSGARLCGVTRQWVGRGGARFAYRGSLGPWPVSDRESARIGLLGGFLAASYRLVGLFGVDFILSDGQPWPVEINPRYTASVEVLEWRCDGRSWPSIAGRANRVRHLSPKSTRQGLSPEGSSSARLSCSRRPGATSPTWTAGSLRVPLLRSRSHVSATSRTRGPSSRRATR